MSEDDADAPGLPVPVEVVGEMVPIVGGAFVVLLNRAWDADMRRVKLLEEEVLARTSERTITQAIGDERKAQLIVMAARAVGLCAWEAKRHAMAEILVTALEDDDAALDDSEMVVLALMDLERHHVRLLAKAEARGEGGFVPADIAAHPGALAGLVRHGAVEQSGIDGGTYDGGGGVLYAITTFGVPLLDLLGRAAGG